MEKLPDFSAIQQLRGALWGTSDARGAAVFVGAGFSRNAILEIPAIPVDRCLTTPQAAAILGRSVDTVKRWRQFEGKGPAFVRYPDGGIRYRLSVIMKFLDTCTVKR